MDLVLLYNKTAFLTFIFLYLLFRLNLTTSATSNVVAASVFFNVEPSNRGDYHRSRLDVSFGVCSSLE